jgi:hypothetical protein
MHFIPTPYKCNGCQTSLSNYLGVGGISGGGCIPTGFHMKVLRLFSFLLWLTLLGEFCRVPHIAVTFIPYLFQPICIQMCIILSF